MHARHAADRAARLAHETHATLTLLHVLPGEPLAQIRDWLGESSVPEQKLRDEAHDQLCELAAKVASDRHVHVSTEDAADRLDARLLVLGARGVGFLSRLVLSTTSERLMRRTDRPALVARQLPHEPCRRVLVAVDFSPWSSEALTLARRGASRRMRTLSSSRCSMWPLDSQARHHEVAAVRRLLRRDQHPGLCVAGGAQARADRIQPSSGYAFTRAVRYLARSNCTSTACIRASRFDPQVVCFRASESADCATAWGRVRPARPLISLPETCQSSWAAIQLTFV